MSLFEQFTEERWRSEPPTAAELAALGFEEGLSFGVEVEFYAERDRYALAEQLTRELGIDARAEGWNNANRPYWKLTTDGSLGYGGGGEDYDEDEDDYEYQCENCECTPECDHECADHGAEPQSWACYSCDIARRAIMPSIYRQSGEDYEAFQTRLRGIPEWTEYERLRDAYQECRRVHHSGRQLEDAHCIAHASEHEYDCETCDTEPECDSDCSEHCDPTYHHQHSSSERGYYGIELVTPPLTGTADVQLFWKVMQALNKPENVLSLTSNCGLHIHIGVRRQTGLTDFDEPLYEELTTPEQLRHIVGLYAKYELALDELLPNGRRANNCDCARSLYSHIYDAQQRYVGVPESPQAVENYLTGLYAGETAAVAQIHQHLRNDRYRKLNLRSYALHGTIEYRQHHGTTSFGEILAWLCLVMRLHRRAFEQHGPVTIGASLPTPANLLDAVKAPPELRAYWLERSACFRGQTRAVREELAGRQVQILYEEACQENRTFNLLREQERLRQRRIASAREHSIWAVHARELAMVAGPDLHQRSPEGLRVARRHADLPSAVRACLDRECQRDNDDGDERGHNPGLDHAEGLHEYIGDLNFDELLGTTPIISAGPFTLDPPF